MIRREGRMKEYRGKRERRTLEKKKSGKKC